MKQTNPGRKFPLPFLILLTTLLVAVQISAPGAIPGMAPKNLNLLVITIDTLRSDHIGAAGTGFVRTPNIDGLARRGVMFTQAVSPVPLTLPSHCSLFTGMLPFSHGVRDNGHRLSSRNTTLAQVAAEEGCATAAFVGAFPLDSRFGLEKGFGVYDDLYGSRDPARDLAFLERNAGAVNMRALEWIGGNSGKRFFVWVHYFDPHAPYEPPPPFDREYAGREYDGEIAYTDQAVGALLEALERAGLKDRTLIVLTSDHGEGLGEHRENTHGIFIYDSTLRVPLILSCPDILPGGRVVTSQVGLVDVMPTILELMGWEGREEMQGRSFVPLIGRPDEAGGGAFYIESLAPLLGRNWAPLHGVRTENWKYIDAPEAELYDLRRDPGERSNLIAREPDVALELHRKLDRILEAGPSSSLLKDQSRSVDPEMRRKLASLGYIAGGLHSATGERPDPKSKISLDNLFNDAVIASASGWMERAKVLFDKVLEEQPDFVVGYEYAAYNLYKWGKLSEAVLLLEEALERGLDTDTVLSRLGLYYQEAGRLDESIATLGKSVSLNPESAEVHNYLGVSLFKSGRVEESIRSFEKALSLDKSYAMAFNNLGNCYFSLDRLELAEEEYRKAIGVDGRLASARNGLAVVLYRAGRVQEAVGEWEASLAIEPDQPDALYNLGRVRLKQGEKKEALRIFELFLRSAQPWKYQKDIEEVRGVVERLKKEIRESVRTFQGNRREGK